MMPQRFGEYNSAQKKTSLKMNAKAKLLGLTKPNTQIQQARQEKVTQLLMICTPRLYLIRDNTIRQIVNMKEAEVAGQIENTNTLLGQMGIKG